MEQSNKKQVITTVLVLVAVVIIVAGVVIFSKKKSTNDTATTDNSNTTAETQGASTTDSTPTDTTATDNTASSSSSTFKDGTYKASGSYTSPGGNESITVSVTLKDGVITDTSATSGANDPTAKEYQADFISGYKDQVVGKKITAVKLSRVSGSSLTSQGFNSAIQTIQQQAKA